MEQTLLALSGRKQSGKGTSYTCIRLWRPEAVEFSFAEPLKRMCVDILGLEEWQAFGTDEQKRTPVPHLLWENFPIPAWDCPNGTVHIGCSKIIRWYEGEFDTDTYIPKKGVMTAREVLQYYSTEIFRKQYHNVWANACIRKIRKSGCPLAVITDCRFPNEVETIQAAGGRVIKLTRNPFPEDNHPSETALDVERYDQRRFDAILDNANMTIDEQCEALYGLLRRWGVVESKSVKRIHV